jgi:hypothetical protein
MRGNVLAIRELRESVEGKSVARFEFMGEIDGEQVIFSPEIIWENPVEARRERLLEANPAAKLIDTPAAEPQNDHEE